MSPRWSLRTARLVLTPVGGADLADLIAIKADPRVFAVMLGGVRTPTQTQQELARDVVAWGAEGFGIWTIREMGSGTPSTNRPGSTGFVGITGLERRPDGRGVALRFALWPEAQGRGLAREAAGAALRFGHDEAGLARIVAVARASNFASRIVLGGIGMTACDSFIQNGWEMVLYESRRSSVPPRGRG
ncbi:MAG TPA: GNAT family N-acetyltransferase [Acetobacteraceae bacterium]